MTDAKTTPNADAAYDEAIAATHAAAELLRRCLSGDEPGYANTGLINNAVQTLQAAPALLAELKGHRKEARKIVGVS